jgi:4,4'-diapophytoene desaturase
MKKIGIIGSGVAALASAARLAHHGFEVTVFEKDEILGGRMNVIQKDGFQFDFGPTIVMMPEIYEQVFKDCNKDPKEYIPMEQLKTVYDLHYPDETISVPSDLTQLHQMLDKIEPDSAAGFFEYLSEIYKRYLIARDHFICRSFRKPFDFFNPATLYQALRLKTFDSADHLLGKYINNDKIKKMLAFQTLYIGISPYQGPSLYSIIPMIEMVYGVWYMKGGMRTMAEGMIRLCKENNVTFYTQTPVTEIQIENQIVKGVIANGKMYDFDIVLNTTDYPYAVTELIKDKQNQGKYTLDKVEQMDYSCSGLLYYFGVDKNLKGKMELHNVVFSNDFDQNIADIFEGRFPMDPSIYVYAASTIDPQLAPEGKDGLYVLIPVPELKTGTIDWADTKTLASYRTLILEKLKRIPALKDLSEHIVCETCITPLDFKEKFNAKYGAAFGLRPTLLQSNAFRPQVALKNVKNLYFAGGSNHPGAGVPIVLTSAEIAVKEILHDLK